VLAVNWPDGADTPEESPLSEDEAGGEGGSSGWMLAGGGGGGGGGMLAGGAEELVSVGGAELVVLVVVELSADEELVVSVDMLCYRLDKRLNCLLVGATPPGFAVCMTRVSYMTRASVRGLASGHRSSRFVLPGYQSLVSG
jgi:hypothetical protein